MITETFSVTANCWRSSEWIWALTMKHYSGAKDKLCLFATNVGEHHPVGWGPEKRQSKREFSLFELRHTSFPAPDTGASRSWAFRIWDSLYQCPLALGPLAWELHHCSSDSRVFGFRLNYTTGFSGPPAYRWQTMGFPASKNTWAKIR